MRGWERFALCLAKGQPPASHTNLRRKEKKRRKEEKKAKEERRTLGRVPILVRVDRHGGDTGEREIKGKEVVAPRGLPGKGQDEAAQAHVHMHACFCSSFID